MNTFRCNCLSTHNFFSSLSHENANFASFLLMIVNWVPFFSLLSRSAFGVGVCCVAEKEVATHGVYASECACVCVC